MSNGSISRLITQLKTTNASDAQAEIFQQYYPELVEHLRRALTEQVLRSADEEDLAASAFQALFANAAKYDGLVKRENLWAMLVTIARRKAINQLKRKSPRGDSVMEHVDPSDNDTRQAADATSQVVMKEMLEKLPGEELKIIAVLKLEGYQNSEIGAQLNRSVATVERRLKLIRSYWKDDQDNA